MSPAPETLADYVPDEDELLDLFVIGGGPHGLATISRLYEPTPNALYSEVEHARLHWIRKHRSNRTVSRDVEEGRAQPAKGVIPHGRFQLEKGPRVVVMDKQRAGWLGTWDTLFVRRRSPSLAGCLLSANVASRMLSDCLSRRTPSTSRTSEARPSSSHIRAISTPSSRTPRPTPARTSWSRLAASSAASGPSTRRRGAPPPEALLSLARGQPQTNLAALLSTARASAASLRGNPTSTCAMSATTMRPRPRSLPILSGRMSSTASRSRTSFGTAPSHRSAGARPQPSAARHRRQAS
jgi:hypothetical protein